MIIMWVFCKYVWNYRFHVQMPKVYLQINITGTRLAFNYVVATNRQLFLHPVRSTAKNGGKSNASDNDNRNNNSNSNSNGKEQLSSSKTWHCSYTY